jgi:hypothetical protein
VVQSLWFWKVFLGGLALHRHFTVDVETVVCGCAGELEELYRWFRGCAKGWSAVTGLSHWGDVQCVLARVTWPSVLPAGEVDYAAHAWAQIASGGLE